MSSRSKRTVKYESERSVDAFMLEAKRYAPLAKDEEQRLAARCALGDEAAIEKLVMHNLLFARRIAGEMSSDRYPVDDLIGEAVLGLYKAAGDYRPEFDVKFISYAVWWIKAYVQQYITRRGGVVRMPAQTPYAVRTLKKYEDLGNDYRYATGEMIREKLGMEADNQASSDNSIALAKSALEPPTSLNTTQTEDGDDRIDSLVGNLQHPLDFVGPYSATVALEIAMECLEPRDREMIEAYYLDEDQPTLDAVGALFDVSREAVRLCVKRGFEMMRKEHGDMLREAMVETPSLWPTR